MRCPKCTVDDDRTIDSHRHNDATTTRRRRECKACRHRWNTIEVAEGDWGVMLEIVGTHLAIDAERPGLAARAEKLGRYFQ